MPRLILVLHDLHAARLSDAARATLPRLPQLERWLARGDVERATGDWRQWLQREVRDASVRDAPPASIAALAAPSVPSDLPVWFATPVHFVAGLDTVRVHPSGLIELSADEQRRLARDFTQVFAGSGWSLHATGRREMLLAGGPAVNSGAVRSHDPALWLGEDPREGLPAGPGAKGLRQLGAEIEMWLYEHPVNLARDARGALNVSALWIWGGGARKISSDVLQVPRVSAPAVAWANDLFVDGLAQLEGWTPEPLPESWPQSPPIDRRPDADLLVLCELESEPGEHTLEMLERRWIAPALEQWRAGTWHSATLLAGACAVTLARGSFRSLWRRWRRTRPWWESLQ